MFIEFSRISFRIKAVSETFALLNAKKVLIVYTESKKVNNFDSSTFHG